MNETSLYQENKEPTTKPKLFGLPRPLVGALIGILLFSLLVLLSFVAKLELLGTTILLPGFGVAYFYTTLDIPPFLDNQLFGVILLLGVPSIPFALFGLLILSKQSTKRVIGIIWSITYFLLLIIVGRQSMAIGN